MQTLAILFIPFLGTALGAGMVFFMRKKMNPNVDVYKRQAVRRLPT